MPSFSSGPENRRGIACVKGEPCTVADFKLETLLFAKDLAADFLPSFSSGPENFVIELFPEDTAFELIDDEDCVIDEKLLPVRETLLFAMDLGPDFLPSFSSGPENFVIELFPKDTPFELIDDEDMDEKLLLVRLSPFFSSGPEATETIL